MLPVLMRGCQRPAASMTGFLRSFASLTQSGRVSGLPSNFQSLVVRSTSSAAHVSTQSAKHVHHDHAKHWSVERVADVALLPLLPYAFYTDSVIANYALILLVGVHTHWGMEAIVIDYMRPRVVGQAGYYASLGFIYLLTFATIAGLLYLNYTQMPPTKAIKKLWTL